MCASNNKVVAVVGDLMFMVKIQDAAKRAGISAVFVKSREAALEQAKLQPSLMILDLNAAVDALALISTLKNDPETKAIQLVGYVSHVQTELRQAAQDRGCDVVIARSAFSQSLPAILERSATS